MKPIERCIAFTKNESPDTDIEALADEAQKELARLRAIEKAAIGLVEYRKHNTLNFQLEKADTFINEMRNNL